MKALAVACTLVLTPSCGLSVDDVVPGGSSRAGNIDDTCGAEGYSPVSGEVTIPADAVPPCAIELVELVRLRGDIDGVAPRPPVLLVEGGRFLTGTFAPGILALWDSIGELQGTFGRGPGEGPGEFGRAAQLIDLGGGRIAVLTTRGEWHLYDLNGEHHGVRRLPGQRLARRGGVFLDNALYLSSSSPDGAELWRASQDTAHLFRAAGPRVGPTLIAGAKAAGLWVADGEDYLLRRLSTANASPQQTIVRVADWFPTQAGRANLYGLQADSVGRLWALVSAADPAAPDEDMPRSSASMEDVLRTANLYRDSRLEVFTVDGRLLGSRIFERVEDAPEPMGGGLWFRKDTDLLESLVIIAARLIPGG